VKCAGISITHGGQPLHLLPCGAAFDEASARLFVADLHLGKTQIFREAGIPLPEGPDAGVLEKLSQCAADTGAREIVVLGDLFHARPAGFQQMLQRLKDWRARHPGILWTVVPGNHDRRVPWDEWLPGAAIVPEDAMLGPWQLRHHPPEDDLPVAPLVCGHLHPGLRLGRSRVNRMHVPCFWQRGRTLILPGFGTFTGLHLIKRTPGDRAWAAAAGRVVEVPGD
jgi:DNA ligase-associated metallophosphoesterase